MDVHQHARLTARVILDEAAQEFAESVGYYEAKEPGLGWKFRTEAVEAIG